MVMQRKKLCPAFRISLVLIVVALFNPWMLHQNALAQSAEASLPDPASNKSTRTDSQGRKITVIDFEDARIEGNAKAPDGFFLRSRSASKSDNILNLRKNFHRRVRSVGHEGLRAVPMN